MAANGTKEDRSATMLFRDAQCPHKKTIEEFVLLSDTLIKDLRELPLERESEAERLRLYQTEIIMAEEEPQMQPITLGDSHPFIGVSAHDAALELLQRIRECPGVREQAKQYVPRLLVALVSEKHAVVTRWQEIASDIGIEN